MKKIFFTTIVMLSSLSAFNSTSVNAFTKPSVSLDTYTIDSVSLKKIDSTIFLNIENQNDIGIELKRIEYKVDINDVKEVAEGTTKKVVKIEKKSDKNKVEVPVSINNSQIFYTLKSIIKAPEKINYSVTGKVYFSTPLGDLPIPFTKSSYVDNTDSIKKIKAQLKSYNPLNLF
jgi:LEA14-like dessication related protein